MSDFDSLMRQAVFEAEDALEQLRRFHGAEVSALCYPALNTVREAAAIIRFAELEDAEAIQPRQPKP